MIRRLSDPRALTLFAGAGLLVWLTLWFGWLAPPRSLSPAFAASIAVFPLLAVAYPLIADRRAGYAWCGFIALGYMAHALTEIFAGTRDRRLALVELVLVGVLFVASGAAYRARRRGG